MELNEKLQSLRAERGVTQAEASRETGIDVSIISRHESGSRIPGRSMIERYASFYGVSTDYLLGRVDERVPEASPLMKGGSADDLIAVLTARGNVAMRVGPQALVPIVGVIMAGMPVLAAENIEGYEFVSQDEVKDGEYVFLRVHGDSMTGDHIPDGSLALVRMQSHAEPQDICVVIVDGDEATLKRVIPSGDGWVTLVSSNPSYPPRSVSARDIQIIGVVTMSVTKHH